MAALGGDRSAAAVAAIPSAAGTADAVLDETLAAQVASGSAGEVLGPLDVAIATRSTLTSADVWGEALPGA